ncbi:hypothetical protein [Moorena sp. SIO4G3]|uniref:hypothetical protein n=1 Tax=Moorena sp. SIO4G3 TaxID=2607821 RepID=UPI00142A36B8|nr:hypothetical protein [Moorena sp. SIO4G3]NEO80344.1 hypothetical protein [Moorena sp. SIO4G3]
MPVSSTVFSGQWSAFSLGQRPRYANIRQPWHRLPACDLTQMLTCCLDAVAHGGNPQDRAASLIQKLIADS